MFRDTLPATFLLALLLGACGGGLAREEVPADPIAYLRQDARGISDVEQFIGGLTLLGQKQARSRFQVQVQIALLVVPSGAKSRVLDTEVGAYPLDWSHDGLRLLVGKIDKSRSGLQLYSWNRLTGSLDRINSGFTAGGAATGTGPIRLVYVEHAKARAGYADFNVRITTDHESGVRLPGTDDAVEPDVALDGTTIVFSRPHPRPGREPLIFLSTLSGGEPRQIARGSNPRFSRDGKWIVYSTRRRGSSDVWLMRANGTGKREVAASSFDEDFPAVSRNGRYVVYGSARGGDKSQLYLTRVRDLNEVQLTVSNQSGRPVW